MFPKVSRYIRVLQRIQKRARKHTIYSSNLASIPELLKSRNRNCKSTGQAKYRFLSVPAYAAQYLAEMDPAQEVNFQRVKPEVLKDVIALSEQNCSLLEPIEKELDEKQSGGKKKRSNRKKRKGKEKPKDGLGTNAAPQASSVPAGNTPSIVKEKPVEAFMNAILSTPENTRNSTKSKHERSHKRNFHSETTPSKGGLPKMNCNEYWPLARVEEGITNGKVITGAFRISQGNYKNAYVSAPDCQRDILIEGCNHRNRALHGDIVAVELIDEDETLTKEVEDIARKLAVEFANVQITEDNLKQTTHAKGRVVYILEKKHCRKVAGMLKPYRNNSFGFALMSPQDSRLPRLMISLNDCPKDFISRPQDFQNVLFSAEITDWRRTSAMASGKLIKELGESGEIGPETEGFLTEYSVDDSPFPEEALACLPSDLPWKLPDEEYSKRKDLRNECIFTIDPATARDLDDALSVKQRDDGNFEVGVHIADVSYFIEEGSKLDEVASSRATSVYLVQRVVPMLPRLLCEHLCSLNPGDDKLTYSVVWTITPDGKVLDEWFGRTVIRSCTKLSYDHAQQMIETDNPDTLDWTQFPDINGSHSLSGVHKCVHRLYNLSLCLRSKRFNSGALALNQPKLSFTLDKETGMPNGFGSFIARDSNRLVEEFMLLANMAVAHRLVRSLPEYAILRRHPVPNAKMVEDLLTLCKRCEIGIDAETSKSLNNSLDMLNHSDIPNKEAIYFAVVSLCSKPMQLAKYFCTGSIEDVRQYHHYALNVPLYTHFTSPIRRYPDVLVHRMLTVALQDEETVKLSVQELQKLAEHCNDKKASAKKVQELSVLLFFNAYIREIGELHEEAVIVGMLDSAMDVLLLHSGIVKRIYCNSLPLHNWKVSKERKDSMTVYWKDDNEDEFPSANGRDDCRVKHNHSSNSAASSHVHAEPKCNAAKMATKNNEEEVEITGQEQTFYIFDKIDVILKSERKDTGPYKVNAYLPRPEKMDN